MNIPIAHSTESLERFLQHIIDNPTPSQVTVTYLRNAGFTTGNDPELRHIFRLLGFLGDNDKPKKRWDLYKTEGKKILLSSLEECYKELFKVIPDAALGRTNAELATWFKPPVTGNSKTSVVRAIRTFRKLCFSAGITPDGRAKLENQDQSFGSSTIVRQPTLLQSEAESRQLIIQVPLSRDQADYERMFEALKKVFYR
jgi:hypothetical protein